MLTNTYLRKLVRALWVKLGFYQPWGRRSSRPAAPFALRLRPYLEVLESRVVPTTVYYEVTGPSALTDGTGAITSGHAGTVTDPIPASTLRAAIDDAVNNNYTATIEFDSALTNSGSATVSLNIAGNSTAGPSDFGITGTSSITIMGPTGGNGITLQNSNTVQQRLFYVSNTASLTLENLTITGGDAVGGMGGATSGGGGGGGGAGLGGAVFVDGGTFSAQGCTFTNNAAKGGTGASYFSTSTATGGGGGGGMGGPGGSLSTGSNGGNGGNPKGGNAGSPGQFGGGGGGGNAGANGGQGGFGGGGGGGGVRANGAEGGFGGGGGGSGSPTGDKPGAGGFGGGNGATSFSGAAGGGVGLGGGIFSNGGALTLTNDAFTANSATGGPGGLGGGGTPNKGAVPAGSGQGLGGAIFAVNGSMMITSATFSSNTASDGGLALYLLGDKNDSGIQGNGSATVTMSGQTLNTTTTFQTADVIASLFNGGVATDFNSNAISGAYTFPAVTAPTVTTPTSASVASTSATLGGDITSNGGASISDYGVLYSTSSSGLTLANVGSGVSQVHTTASTSGVFTESVTGLSPGTQYYYVAYATNSAGTSYTSPVATFTTQTVAPTVTTPTSASVTSTSATLGGDITSNGGATITDYGVLYSTSSSGLTLANVGSGVSQVHTTASTSGVFTEPVTGLSSATQYYYVAYATNSQGTTYTSPVSTFTTQTVAPTVTTPTSASVTSTSATLGGDITSNGGASISDYGVLYSTSSSGLTLANVGSGVSQVHTSASTSGVFTESVTGLSPGTQYYYVAYATNSAGTNYTSPVSTFTTQTVAPTVTTPTSASVTSTSATLGGDITSNGGASISDYGVLYSLSSSGLTLANVGSGVSQVHTSASTSGVFTESVTGLSPGTQYYYVAYATNSAGTNYTSPVSTFTTQTVAPTVTTPTSASVTSTSATLGGDITSNGGATVSDYGVLYSLSSSGLTLANVGSGVSQVHTTASTSGVFTESVTGLSPATQYYYVAYATNSAGTNYTSPVSTFTTNSIVAGNNQSATLATAFGTALQVVVKDANGNVLSGVAVTFTVQVGSGGASGNFNGSATATVTTSSTGLATAPRLTAGDKPGSFTVLVSVAGLPASDDVVFTLTVTGRGSPVF